MSIEIQCAGCESHLRVADEHAGKQARCPKCGTIQTIPSGVAVSDSAGPAAPDLASPGSGAPRESAETSTGEGSGRVSTPSPFQSSPNPPGTFPASAPSSSLANSVQRTAPVMSRHLDTGLDQWTLRTPDGREYGPVPRHEMDVWVGENRVSAQCRLRRGLGDWVLATTFYPDLPVGTQEVLLNSAGGWSPTNIYPENHRGGLILALGILGLIFTCPILSIMAWVMGSKDLGKMKARVMDPAGEDMTKVGYVLGLFWSLVCILLMTVITMLVIAAGAG